LQSPQLKTQAKNRQNSTNTSEKTAKTSARIRQKWQK